MATGPIAEGFVDVVPNMGRFESGLETGVARAMAQSEQIVAKAADDIVDPLRRAFGDLDDYLLDFANDAARHLESVSDEAIEAGNVIERSFEEAADAARYDLERLGEEAFELGIELESAIQRGAEAAEDELRQLGDVGEREFDRLEREANDSGGRIGGGFNRMLGGLAAGLAVLGIGNILGDAVDAAEEAGNAFATVEQIIEQTGGAAGKSAEELADSALDLALEIGVDDTEIQNAQARLLTFTTVAGDEFDRTIALAADAAAAGIGSLEGNAAAFGRTLNDPIAGMSRLARQGIVFTDSQTEAITALQESGDLMGAQNLLLDAMEERFGGAAAASVDASEVIGIAFGEVQEALGAGLVDAIDAIAPALIEAAAALGPIATIAGEALGGILEAATPLLSSLVGILEPIIGILSPIVEGFAEGLAGAMSIVGEVFREVAPELQTIGELLGDALAEVLPIVVDLLTRLTGPALGALADVLIALIPALVDIVTILVDSLTPIFDSLGPIIRTVGTILATVLTTAIEALAPVLQAILPVLGDALITILEAIQPILPQLAEAFGALVGALGEILLALTPLIPPLLELVLALVDAGLINVLPILVELLTLFAEGLTILAPYIQLVAEWLAGQLSTGLDNAAVKLGEVAAWVGRLFQEYLVPFGTWLADTFVTTILPALQTAFGYVSGAIENLVEIGSDLWHELLEPLAGFLVDTFTTAINGLFWAWSGIATVLDVVVGFFGDVIDVVEDVIDWVDDLIDKVEDALGPIGDLVGGIANVAGNIPGVGLIPGFADGGVFLDDAGLAMLHGPEVVIPMGDPGAARGAAAQAGGIGELFGLDDDFDLPPGGGGGGIVVNGPLIGTLVSPDPLSSARTVDRGLRKRQQEYV